jgi:type II secretory pathway component PulJ
MLARVIDERLNSVTDRHHASGRRTSLALRITAAMQTMSNTLTELKQHWCETTTEQHPASRPQPIATATATAITATGHPPECGN